MPASKRWVSVHCFQAAQPAQVRQRPQRTSIVWPCCPQRSCMGFPQCQALVFLQLFVPPLPLVAGDKEKSGMRKTVRHAHGLVWAHGGDHEHHVAGIIDAQVLMPHFATVVLDLAEEVLVRCAGWQQDFCEKADGAFQ